MVTCFYLRMVVLLTADRFKDLGAGIPEGWWHLGKDACHERDLRSTEIRNLRSDLGATDAELGFYGVHADKQ